MDHDTGPQALAPVPPPGIPPIPPAVTGQTIRQAMTTAHRSGQTSLLVTAAAAGVAHLGEDDLPSAEIAQRLTDFVTDGRWSL